MIRVEDIAAGRGLVQELADLVDVTGKPETARVSDSVTITIFPGTIKIFEQRTDGDEA